MVSLNQDIPDTTELRQLQDYWRGKGKTVGTIRELVLCYYYDIKIVCIPPMTGVPICVKEQFEKLRKTILEATKTTSDLRRTAGALMGGEKQDFYFRRAFSHFSENYGKENPFNFLDAENQFETGFGTTVTHIIKAATQLMGNKKYASGTQLFTALEPLLASSIMLDARRKDFTLDLGMSNLSVLLINHTKCSGDGRRHTPGISAAVPSCENELLQELLAVQLPGLKRQPMCERGHSTRERSPTGQRNCGQSWCPRFKRYRLRLHEHVLWIHQASQRE